MREVGLSGAELEIPPKVLFTGEGGLLAGDTARFRKGLFEGNLVASPGEFWVPDSVSTNGMLVNGRRVLWAGERLSWPILYLHETGCVDKFGQWQCCASSGRMAKALNCCHNEW